MDLQIKLTIEVIIEGKDTTIIAAERAVADFFSDTKTDLLSIESACGKFVVSSVVKTAVDYEN